MLQLIAVAALSVATKQEEVGPALGHGSLRSQQ